MNRIPKPTKMINELVLPFSTWRILELIDGQRSTEQIGLLLGLSSEEAVKQVDAICQMIERLERQAQEVDEAIIDQIYRAVIRVLGPWGKIVVEDAIKASGNSPTLAQLLNQLIRETDEESRPKILAELRNEGLI